MPVLTKEVHVLGAMRCWTLDPGSCPILNFGHSVINVDRSSVFGLKGHSLAFVFPDFGFIHNLSLDHNYKPHLKSTHEKDHSYKIFGTGFTIFLRPYVRS